MLPPVSDLYEADAALVASVADRILLKLEEALGRRRPGEAELCLPIHPEDALWGTLSPCDAFLEGVADYLTKQVQPLGYQGVTVNPPSVESLFYITSPVYITLNILPPLKTIYPSAP